MSWEREEGWNKKPGPRRPRGRARHGKPEPGAAGDAQPSTWETSRRKAEKRQKRRRVSWIIGAVTVVLALLVVLAPTIAGALAPGFIADAASGAIAGRVEVGSVSLSWFGDQRVEQIRLYDRDNERRGDLNLTADRGLLALAFAGGDFGTITLSGELDASENERGEPFTEHTVQPTASPSSGPAPTAAAGPPALPKRLRVTLALDDLSIRYARREDSSPIDAIMLEDFSGTARIDTTAESVIDLNARLTRRLKGDANFERAGTIAIDASATGLTDQDGTLTPDALAFEATINAADLETAIADLFTGGVPPIAEALGRSLTVNTSANGSAAKFATTVTINCDAVRADAPLEIDLEARTIASTEPVTARLDTERLSFLVPDRDTLFGADASVRVAAFPSISVTLDRLRAPIPAPGEAIDLRRAGAEIVAEIGRLAASLDDPATGTERAVGFEPSTLTLSAADLTQPVRLTTSIGTTVDGARSGTLAIDLAASGIIDDSGGFNTSDLPVIEGSVRAASLALTAFQPVAQAFGFDLVASVGDSADLTIEATPREGGATAIAISGDAPRARIAGSLALDGPAITTTGAPLTLTLDRPDAALAGYLAGAGIELTGASGLTITLDALAINLEQLGKGDLSTLAMDLNAGVDRLDAVLAETGERVSIENATLGVRTPGVARGVRVKAGNKFTLDGSPAGRIDADLTATDLLDPSGAPAQGLPSNVRGRIALGGVRTAALGAFVPLPALDLPADIGPVLNAEATLTPRADAHTGIALTITSEHLNGTGALAIGADGLTGGDDALVLELARVGPLLERVLNTPDAPGAIEAKTPGRVSLRAANLALPLDPASLKTDGRATITATLADLALVGPGGPAGTVRRIGIGATLAPGADPVVTLDGTLLSQHAGEVLTGTIDGAVTLSNAFEPADDTGRPRLAPNGTIRVRDLPTNFARLASLVFPGLEGQAGTPLDRVLADTVGPTASLAVELARDAADPASALKATIDLDAGRHTADATISAAPRAGGAFSIADLSADARLALDEGTVRAARAVAAPGMPASVRVTREGAAVIRVRNDQGTLRADATIEATTLDGLTAPPRSGAPASAPPRRLDPITLAGTAGVVVPLAMLNEPQGAHAVAFTADLRGSGAGPSDTPALTLVANGNASIERGAPTNDAGVKIRLASRDTAWLDALAGQNGLLAEALGDRVDIRADLSAAFPGVPHDGAPATPMPTKAEASVIIDSPALRTQKPAIVTIDDGTLRLREPLRAAWTITPALVTRLAPPEPGKVAQVVLAAPVDLSIEADRIVLPLDGGSATPDFSIRAGAPALPLRFSDGSSYRLTDLAMRLSAAPEAGSGTLVVTASTEDAGADATTPIAIDATVNGLPKPGADFDPASVSLGGVATINELPMRLIDALAGADGALVALLGPALDAEATARDLPLRDGTLTLRMTTAQSSLRYDATVRPHPAFPDTLALAVGSPATAEITHFNYDFAGKRVAFFPIFGSIEKIEKTHRPASVRVTQLITPVDGDIAKINMRASVDPGVVKYKFERGLETLLEVAKQRTESNAGERLEPFEVTMANGIARFDRLAVPAGEFTMTAKGSFDLVRRYEDITLGVPAGAFAGEVIGNLPGATGGLLNKDIIVPVRRRGSMDEQNRWEPDFDAVLKQLFSPENILKNVIDGGLKDLIKDGGRPGGGGGG